MVTQTARRRPGRPPAARSAQTRGRILRTAREVFSELGYDAATFQEIAVRSDLTRPAINHYFPGKRALYRQVVEQTNHQLIDAGVAEAHRRDGFAERIRAFVEAAVQAQDRDRAASAFLVTSVLEAQRHPELGEQDHDTLAATRQFIRWTLSEAEADGELVPGTDPDALAETLLAMLLGLGIYAGFVGTAECVAAITDQFLGLLRGRVFVRSA